MLTYLQSLQNSLKEMMKEDETIYLLGEDILDPYGGAFKVSLGLSTLYPTRVITTPISEAALVGVANGMALRGLRPIIEIMFGDFITLTADQIINYATKFRQMYKGQVDVPITIRTPMGGGRSYGPTHSQSLEKIFFGIPNLDIVAPSHLHDAGSLLKHAVLHDNGPVLFIENKLLYTTRLSDGIDDDLTLEVVEENNGYSTTLVHNFKQRKADVTIISYGGASRFIIPLMKKLIEEEIWVTTCFPSCIKPFPEETLIRAAAASGRVIIVEEGTAHFNWGSEVAARLYEKLWKKLLSPIQRISAMDSIIPAAPSLEAKVLPSIETLEAAVYEVIV